MRIVIAGGSGFLGTALTQTLQEQEHDVIWLSSNPQKITNHLNKNTHNLKNVTVFGYDALDQLTNVDVLINLAGAGIADKPWTQKRKHVLESSRIQVTEQLVNWLTTLENPPHTFISGSAVGWYGVQGNQPLTEDSQPVSEYQHVLCDDWEKAALLAKSIIPRVIILRTGVVLDTSGGMLAKIKTPFSLGLGGNLGSGQQILSWISLIDWVNAVLFLLNSQQQGVFNLTAPNPVTNAEFTKALAGYLKRPAFFHVPAFVLKMTLGEMSTLLLNGQKVLPTKLLAAGFIFRHQTLAKLFDTQNKR